MVSRSNAIRACMVIMILSVSFTGCSTNKLMVKSMDPLMEEMNTAVNRNPDVDMVRDALPANLIQLDGFIAAAPETKLLLRASEAYFGYSFAFVEDTDKDRAGYLYLKARNYALRALTGSESYEQDISKPIEEFRTYVNDLGKGDVPALYWSANCWMAWIALNLSNPAVLMDVPKVEAMLQKVVELDEKFYYGAAHATLGAFYASRSKTIGGDPEKAKQHFDRAFQISESKLLFIHLLYAQYYAYQIQDRDLFEQTLQKVISTPVNFFPEKNFANEVAKRKARVLLNNIDEYF